jgi:hypothetical protein
LAVDRVFALSGVSVELSFRLTQGRAAAMKTKKTNMHSILGACLLAGLLSPISSAIANDLVFDPGQACEFGLKVEGSKPAEFKEFKDKDGNLVRLLSAGKGPALSFTNLSNKATLPLKANGSVTQITFGSDGLQTWASTGHNILILFPSDIPAGPSTTLHVGRVVFTVDGKGVFTVQEVSGGQIDICAALSE